MQMPKSKYEQTKICDMPLTKEMKSVQDIFSVVSIDESGVFELTNKKRSVEKQIAFFIRFCMNRRKKTSFFQIADCIRVGADTKFSVRACFPVSG